MALKQIYIYLYLFFENIKPLVSLANKLFKGINLFIIYLRKTCEIPITEGSIFSYYNSNQTSVLSSGAQVEQYRTVTEKCHTGYYQKGDDRNTFCSGDGNWSTVYSDKLCYSEYTIVLYMDLMVCYFKVRKWLRQ